MKVMAEKFSYRPNPAIYEINTTVWLYELSLKLGKTVRLGDVPPAEWDALKAKGMDFVWLMGVWSRSRQSRAISLHHADLRRLFDAVTPDWTADDVIGSPYSISEAEPSPLIDAWKDIDSARRELHRRGLGLVLDFIPNHTGLDHPWLSEHPEYFIQGALEDFEKEPAAFFSLNFQGRTLYIAHGRDPNFPPWTDTAQINYFNPAARLAMIKTLEKIAQHCDGVRCDMAMLVLNDVFRRTWGGAGSGDSRASPEQEFWAQAFERLPGLVYIAEAYWDTEWTLQQMGFDFTYDKRLYDRLKGAHAHEVYLHLKAETGFQQKLLRFVENHDETRSAAVFGHDKAKAAAALISTLPGMRLYFQGQFEGRQVHLPLQIRRSSPEAVDANIKAFYDTLLPLAGEEVFHSGSWQLKEVFAETAGAAVEIIACTWKLAEKFMLTVVNLSPDPSTGRICFQEDVSNEASIEIFEQKEYIFQDRLSAYRFSHNGKLLAHPGIYFTLAGYQARIFEITPA